MQDSKNSQISNSPAGFGRSISFENAITKLIFYMAYPRGQNKKKSTNTITAHFEGKVSLQAIR